MKESKNNIQKTINYLIENNIHFAIYSLPNNTDIYLNVDEQKQTETGFVIQDFDSSNKENVIGNDIFLKNEEISISKINHITKLPKSKENNNDNLALLNKKEYEAYVSLIVNKCKLGTLKKAVPARIKKHVMPKGFDLGNYFLKLVSEYKNAFVNLYYHKNCGLWIGATPELLVKEISSNAYETYSLAGTKVISENRKWSNKEIEEQQIVTDYIVNSLKDKNCKIEEISKACNIKAGMIEHLKSTIQFTTKKTFQEVAKLLHPTPAVCGMPLKKSFDLIKKIENNQRENYTGYVGLNIENKSQFYVNLRCMQIFKKHFKIHIGAGVTKDSNPEKEWFETENKSLTLLNLL